MYFKVNASQQQNTKLEATFEVYNLQKKKNIKENKLFIKYLHSAINQNVCSNIVIILINKTTLKK
jgi:hypothetical protein